MYQTTQLLQVSQQVFLHSIKMKKLQTNIILNFSYQILLLVFPLLTTPYLSRILGAEGIGAYSFVISVTAIFSNLILLGLPKYGSREIAFIQNDKEKRTTLFSELYLFQIVSFLLCSVVYFCMVFFIPRMHHKEFYYGYPVLLAALFNITWYFWGVEKFKITVPIFFIVKILFIVLIFILIRNQKDIYKYIIIFSITTVLSWGTLFFFLRKEVFRIKLSISNSLKHIKPVLVLFIPVIAISIYKLMDKIMLGLISDNLQLGFYDSAEKIVNIPVALISSLGVTMLPRISSLNSEGKTNKAQIYLQQTFILVLIITIFFSFGYYALGNEFVLLFFGYGFEPVSNIMQVLAISVVFLGCGDVIRSQYLIPKQMDKVYLTSAIIGATCNVLFNILFIPRYGALGAAWGTVIAEFSVFIYQFCYVKKVFIIKDILLYLLVFSTIGYSMIYFINLVHFNILLVDFLIKCVIGGIYYFLLSFFMLKFLELHKIKHCT